jgi:hypothetical protein
MAQAPVTWGVAWEVPLKKAKPPPGTEELMKDPGASRERKEAEFEEKIEFERDETTSDLVVEPTLTAEEIQAGATRALVNPSFPAAATVAIPTERRLSIIAFPAACVLSHGEVNSPPPKLTLTAAIVCWLLRASTLSPPAITSETETSAQGSSPAPAHWLPVTLEETCTAIMCAPLATPEKVTPAPAPDPAAIPARCVPC